MEGGETTEGEEKFLECASSNAFCFFLADFSKIEKRSEKSDL